MSYRPNQSQQLSIFDRSLRLTERERKCLEKSWAKVFSDEIFPAIDEDRFRVLYSETASRPNTPVAVPSEAQQGYWSDCNIPFRDREGETTTSYGRE